MKIFKRTLLMTVILSLLLFLSISVSCNNDSGELSTEAESSEETTELTDDLMYMGQNRPGLIPEVFAPGIISIGGQSESNITFTPDGKEIYYVAGTDQRSMIMTSRLENGEWTEPESASFSQEYSNWGPFVSPDGQKLYFTSNRPPEDSSSRSDPNIWVVRRTEDGSWSSPEILPEPVNSESWDGIPSVYQDGTLVFISDRDGAPDANIYKSDLSDEGYVEVEKFPEPVNTTYPDIGPILTIDMQYLIFASMRPGASGEDIYISARNEDSSWSEPRNLGEPINTPGPEYAPRLSLDNEFLFYCSNDDLYWVDSPSKRSDKTGN